MIHPVNRTGIPTVILFAWINPAPASRTTFAGVCGNLNNLPIIAGGVPPCRPGTWVGG